MKRRHIYIISFISGMCVMSLEISASRLIAPYFGTSLFVWTNVIGIVMISLSLGYYLGGRLAEKFPQPSLLYKIIGFAGGFAAIIPFAGRPLSRLIIEEILIAPASFLAFVGSFLALLFLFALPVGLLGAVSPFLIKLMSKEHSDMGNVSGSLFALGTLGSIFGTFLPTLVLIPFAGTKMTITLTGLALLLTAIIGGAGRGKTKALALIPLTIPFLPINADAPSDLLYETESPYQLIRVFERSNGLRELRFNEGLGAQSVWTPSGLVGSGYWDYPSAFFMLRETFPKKVAVLGLAGGTISRSAALAFPNRDFTIDGAEIDSKVIKTAKKYFDLERSNLRIFNADARVFLNSVKGTYDLIFVDAYASQQYIPYHMVTREFFTEVKNKINGNGILVMNVNAVSISSPLLSSIANTVASVFPDVKIISVPGTYNFLILGSSRELDLAAAGARLPKQFASVKEALLTRAVDWKPAPAARVLTDDKAPIELMTDALFFEILGQQLKNS